MLTVHATQERRTVFAVRDPMAGRDGLDEVLLARVLAGDERALGLVYDQHSALVRGLARRVTGDDQLACDVTQEVFVYLWQHADRVDLARGTLRSFLRVVAHRRAVDAVRRAARLQRAEQAAHDDDCDSPLLDDEIARADADSWSRARLLEAIDALPGDQREAIVLAYFGGYPLREVAGILGIPEGTARSRVHLGLARVRGLAGDALRADR